MIKETNFPTLLILILGMLISCVIFLPTLDVQESLTAGDVGNNLYITEAITKGQIPYRDFFWPYGPLMHYYNAICFKLFGSKIQSLILGRIILKTLFAGVFFLAAKKIMPPFAAFLATIAFAIFTPDFVHNFTHYGGVCMEVGILWAIFSYYQEQKKKYILWAGFFILLLGFIKINFGVLFIIGGLISFLLCDLFRHRTTSLRIFYTHGYCILSTLIIWAGLHYLLLKDLSIHEINQCFPFFKGYCYFGGSFFFSFINFFKRILENISHNTFDLILTGVVALASLRLLFHMTWNHSCIIVKNRNGVLIIGILLLLMASSYHEYFKGGIDYQAYWAQPFTIMSLAYLISEASVISGRVVLFNVYILTIWFMFTNEYNHWKFYQQFKNKEHYFYFNHMNIYVTNAPQDIKSILETANYIVNNIPKESAFFCFTANDIYYYLADRLSPYRLLQLIMAMNITPEQEMDMIQNLEKNHVEYLVMGAGSYQGGGMMGVLGENYCFLFDKYIKKYFKEIARFGQWKETPSGFQYVGGTGSRILKRKNSEYLNIKSSKDLD